jgi:Ni,Fe-hydrogenase III small subunit
VNVLNTIVYDLGRFGVQFVASPRHADGLLITGPVTRNMRGALARTYKAVPDPKIVIAVGACAISGGPYAGLPEAGNGADSFVPVDLYVPGCPPHPVTILDGMLRLIGRIGGNRESNFHDPCQPSACRASKLIRNGSGPEQKLFLFESVMGSEVLIQSDEFNI